MHLVSSRALTVAHISLHDPSPALYPKSPESRHQLRRQRKKSGKGKGCQTRETSLEPDRPHTPPPQPSTSHATPHSSDGSTPRGRTGQPLPSPPSPILLHPAPIPSSHNPMASPPSSHHTASHCRSPRTTSAPAAAPASGPTLPAWAQYLTAPNPTTGASTASAAGLALPAEHVPITEVPTMEAVIRMIWDTQQSIGVLSIALGKLTRQVNDLIQVQVQGSTPPAEHGAKATKSMVACPKPWDGKGDSAAAHHFLAAFANWASSQKEKMNWKSVFSVWIKKDLD